MKKLKLCNVHKLALSNEGEGRKPIHIPFGTWAYDDRIDQTLDREHAEAIAADLAGKIAAGEPGIPVYQGHPDVPEYAGKYPDKGALGWVKKILVNENGMDLEVEWDRDPGKGFGWFSPYWTGDDPGLGASGKKNVIVDGLTSIGLVNNPNIREFRLANESGENLTRRGGEAEVAAFKLPDHLLALAKRFDGRMALANVIDANGMGHSDENGQFDGSGSGNGGGSAQSSRLDRMLGEARSGIAKAKEAAAASRARRSSGRAELEARIAKIRQKRLELKDFNDRMEKRLKTANEAQPEERKTMKPYQLPQRIIDLANEYDESKHPRAEDGKWTSTGGGGASAVKKAETERHAAKFQKSEFINWKDRAQAVNGVNTQLKYLRDTHKFNAREMTGVFGKDFADISRNEKRGLHLAAIRAGLKYNYGTHQYE